MTDPFPGISRCIVHALSELGVPIPDRQSLGSWIGPPLLASFQTWFEEQGIEADPETALGLYRGRFAELGLYENTVYDGISDSLAKLRNSGFRLLLATAKPEVYAQKIVDHFSLNDSLAGVYGSELDGRRGEKTELLQYILERHDLDARHCVMIGDRKHDMLAAAHHGIRAVGVLWGYGSEEELLSAGAEVLVREPRQLHAAVTGHWPARNIGG